MKMVTGMLFLAIISCASCDNESLHPEKATVCVVGDTCDVPFELLYSGRTSAIGVDMNLYGYYLEADPGLEIEGIEKGTGLLFSSKEQADMCNASAALLILKNNGKNGNEGRFDNSYVKVTGKFIGAPSARFWGAIDMSMPMVFLGDGEKIAGCMKKPPPPPPEP